MGVIDHPLSRDLDSVLERTESVWPELEQGRLFVTGGTGFFGCWLLESIAWARARLKRDVHAVVVTRDPDGFWNRQPRLAEESGAEFVKGDATEFEFPSGHFSHVVHAAPGPASSATEDPVVTFNTIVDGTRRVLYFAAQSGVRRLLFASSGAVYGRQPPELTHVPEEYAGAPDPLLPASAYGEGKRAAEFLCASAPLECVVARCFALVGPYLPLDRQFAVGNFISDGLACRAVAVLGDGTPFRSYLYAADLAVWLLTLLVRAPANRAYNVGSGEAISIGELAEKVAAEFEPRAPVRIRDVPVPGRAPERYVPSVERVRRELGLEPTVGLDDALRRTVAWHRREK
jgi:nucleoside-diphosphate-sugar epimerase